MQLFALNSDPVLAAKAHCDRHVPKMLVEAVQLLSGAYPENVAPYKHTHLQTPCSKWIRFTEGNWKWGLEFAIALANEHTFRFSGNTHKTKGILYWISENPPSRKRFLGQVQTPFAQNIPEEFRGDDPIAAYRKYYHTKAYFAKWQKGRNPPEWW